VDLLVAVRQLERRVLDLETRPLEIRDQDREKLHEPRGIDVRIVARSDADPCALRAGDRRDIKRAGRCLDSRRRSARRQQFHDSGRRTGTLTRLDLERSSLSIARPDDRVAAGGVDERLNQPLEFAHARCNVSRTIFARAGTCSTRSIRLHIRKSPRPSSR
jgi:hypothetical protein